VSERTLKIDSPHMRGDDVRAWQRELHRRFKHWGVNYPLKVDGDYGIADRAATATMLHGLGIAQSAMADGVTPELRIKVRNSRLSPLERARFVARTGWRRRLRRRYEGGGVCSPLVKIITHANGFSSWHDGVDLICPTNAHGYAICRAKVVRADAGGWWGLGAPANRELKARGDGIVIIRSLVDVGPIRKGMNFCYGHAEQPRVKVGDVVEAGDWICNAGFANAPHFHMMVNANPDTRGIGTRDPWPIIAYAIRHA
jgi:murein DD-endopeptidase MepM/ murein hydrolase activator NlpD